MIKLGFRYNLLYPLMLIILTTIRRADTITMYKIIGFDGSLFLTLIMFLAEIIIGLIFYLYYLSFLSKEKNPNSYFMGIKLITTSSNIKPPDNILKIYLLIFMAAFFDFNIFLIGTYYLPREYNEVSSSLNIRLRSVLTISSAFGCFFILRIPIFRHQKFSLFIISLCLITIIISEFFFMQEKVGYIIYALILNFICYFFNSCLDLSEKYLLDYDFVNPFRLIMVEGIIGFILGCIFSIIVDPFKDIKEVFENKNNTYNISDSMKLIFLIIFLVIYFISSGGRNIYRLITNKLYSPMTRTLTDCFLDPLLIIYYYFGENDFIYNESQNLTYFIINLVTSFIIVFCSCVYNEIFIIFHFKLEHNTHYQISKRATLLKKKLDSFDDDINYSDDSSEQDKVSI